MGGVCSCVGKTDKKDVVPKEKSPDENGEQQNKVEETQQNQEEEKQAANGGEATASPDTEKEAEAVQMSNDIVNEAVAEASQQHEQEVAASE